MHARPAAARISLPSALSSLAHGAATRGSTLHVGTRELKPPRTRSKRNTSTPATTASATMTTATEARARATAATAQSTEEMCGASVPARAVCVATPATRHGPRARSKGTCLPGRRWMGRILPRESRSPWHASAFPASHGAVLGSRRGVCLQGGGRFFARFLKRARKDPRTGGVVAADGGTVAATITTSCMILNLEKGAGSAGRSWWHRPKGGSRCGTCRSR